MMGEPVVLLTIAEIDTAGFAEVVRCLGGVVDANRADRGRISRGRCHVWLYLGAESFADIPPAVAEQIAAKLGAMPRTGWVLEPSRKPGTERLVIDVAKAFAERWRAVLWDIETDILDLADLRRLTAPPN
jgi:hypothetical protein